MIQFLWKGLLRDRSRSLFPLLVVAAGVMLTVFLHAYMNGVVTMLIQSTAHYSTGHVRVMTESYANEADQIPNDLALLGIDTLLGELRERFPDFLWTPRIKFGGLLDIPDQNGETSAQSPVFGTAVDLLSLASPELRIMNIEKSIVRGRLPRRQGEILVADDLAEKLGVHPGETATLISSTMNGSMSVTNFAIAGTVRFGVAAMDRGAMIADLGDAQGALDMQNGAGEILGFSHDDVYHEERANAVTAEFNSRHRDLHNKFSPLMGTLRSQSGLADYFDLIEAFSGVFISIFVIAMSIVLWNTGLTGNLRRYGEIGVRLAIGEDKGHVYRSLLSESVMVGLAGSMVGAAVGLAFASYMQMYGINLEWMMKGSTMMISNIIRARITPMTFLIGFVPGMLATILGSAVAGIGIYKRQTAQLFKELEA